MNQKTNYNNGYNLKSDNVKNILIFCACINLLHEKTNKIINIYIEEKYKDIAYFFDGINLVEKSDIQKSIVCNDKILESHASIEESIKYIYDMIDDDLPPEKPYGIYFNIKKNIVPNKEIGYIDEVESDILIDDIKIKYPNYKISILKNDNIKKLIIDISKLEYLVVSKKSIEYYIATGLKIPIIENALDLKDKKYINKLEILVCCYGDYSEISLNCLNKLLDLASSPDNISIRVGLNNCNFYTIKGIQDLYAAGKISTIIESKKNLNKDPMMKLLLDLVEEDYFVWFDDDSYPIQKNWDIDFKNYINSNIPFTAAGFIHVSDHSSFPGYRQFLEKRPWFVSVDKMYLSKDQNIANNKSVFPIGCCWIGSTKDLIKNNFPDKEMIKKCDDMLLGDMIVQTNGKLLGCNELWDKVKINSEPRRGVGEDIMTGWKIDRKNNFEGMTIIPWAGVSNRIQMILTGIVAASDWKIPCKFLWQTNATVGYCKFEDLFEEIPDVEIQNITYEESEVIISETGFSEIRWHLMRLHNIETRSKNPVILHWGYVTGLWEDHNVIGFDRLVQGHAKNLIKPNKKLKDIIDIFTKNNNINNKIGIHMRAFEFYLGDRKQEDIESLVTNFCKIIDNNYPKDEFFLATDSNQVRNIMIEKYKNRICFYSSFKEEYMNKDSKDEIEYGVIDFFILSNCKKILGTKGSTFSGNAAMIKNKEISWALGPRDPGLFYQA